MKITNQKPQVLSPLYKFSTARDFDIDPIMDAVITDQISTPLIASSPVIFQDDAGNQLDKNDIRDIFKRCCADQIDLNAERQAKEILGKTLINYNGQTDMPIDECFLVQASTKAGLPEPSSTIIYAIGTDVIAPSKGLIAGTTSFDEWFACFGYALNPDTLGFAFANKVAFDNFKTWLSNQMASIAGTLPPTTVQTVSDFQNKVTLDDLTESLWLRKSANDNNEPHSFARFITTMLITYVRDIDTNTSWCCPFSLDRLIIPETIVLINVERHSQAQADEINNEWTLIQDSIKDRIVVMKPGQIQKLTAARRQMQKTSAAVQQMGAKDQAIRAINAKFRKTPPTTVDIIKLTKKLLDKMSQVNHSQNSYKNVKMSFARPNRRDPDDFNKQGKIVSTRYRPDIHLYVDTSGSISEAQYQDAVKACIALARKLDINLYFNSFSHIMTTTTFLQTKGRSVSQIWRELQKVPKVSGGTNFSQVWDYILASKKRRRELSLMITDFEWSPSSRRREHPNNLYYIPISNANWEYIVADASRFAQSMKHIDPDIRRHILM